MRLDDRLCNAEEGRAADLVLVEQVAELIHALFAREIAQLGRRIAHEYVLDRARHELGNALNGLEHHVARVPIAHRDVARAERYHAALDVADKVEPALVTRFFEQRVSFFTQRVALGVLGAVVDQTHARVFDAVDLLCVQRAEEGELQQHLSRAFGVRARVAQHDLPALAGHDRRERAAADALDAAAVQRRAGEQRARVARGHERIALARFEQFERHRHRGVRLMAQHSRGVVVHVHQIGRRHDGHARGVLHALILEDRRDLVRVADEQHFLAVFLRRERAAPGCRLRCVVAAHCVHNDLHIKAPLSDCRSFRAPARKSSYFSPACP